MTLTPITTSDYKLYKRTPYRAEELQRIKRAQVKAVTMALLDKQKWRCPLCGDKINPDVQGHKSDYCLDHNHENGEVRAVLHRSCNSAEGKALSALGRWGAGKVSYEAVIPYMERLLEYWKQGRYTGLMYPDHKTPEQQKAANLLKRRKAAAVKKATATMKGAAK